MNFRVNHLFVTLRLLQTSNLTVLERKERPVISFHVGQYFLVTLHFLGLVFCL